MATVSRPTGREPNINLTNKQLQLIKYLEYRQRYGMPTVQQDAAEALGIRRDSLNKLLRRTRQALARQGRDLPMPPRHRAVAARVVGLLPGE